MRYIFLTLVLALAFGATLVGHTLRSEVYLVTARSAAELYLKQCASCHGKDGRARTLKGKLKHARNLTDAQWQDSVSDERLFNSINNGKGKMPAYGKKLSQQEIEALVAYVRALKAIPTVGQTFQR
ncbi:MAG: cytochrome c [Acidobacteriota bacterium]|nr:cytochrome c [Acidobacteriota bacterium]